MAAMSLIQRGGAALAQSQRQSISPRMWLALNLLTLPVSELREAVQKEVNENPAIEDADFSPVRSLSAASRAVSPEARDAFFENQVREESLDEHLLRELALCDATGREREIAEQVIANLDEDGRFVGSIPDMTMASGATAEEIERARRLVMTLDPIGCGARSLGECFAAQAEKVAAAKRAELLKICATIDDVLAGRSRMPAVSAETVRLLKTLDPKPGRRYSSRRDETIVPDITVGRDGAVSVEQGDLPDIRISPRYEAMARDQSLDEETRRYAAERVRHAKDLQLALVQRADTIERIARCVVDAQRGFIEKGLAARRKLTMGEVARAAKCHVSTVSRAAARKYVKTPRGMFSLRSFFGVVDGAREAKLAEIIGSLPPNAHVSDRSLAEAMERAGLPMARRTVAKYRARLSKPNGRCAVRARAT